MSGIIASNVFVVLATKNYLNALRNQDMRLLKERETAKLLNKPTILIISETLAEDEKKEIENCFENHNVIGKISFNEHDKDSIRDVALKIGKLIKQNK